MTTMALNPARSGGMTSEERLVIFASSLGTVFEWYDFYIYGTLAVFLAKYFFSSVPANVGLHLHAARLCRGLRGAPVRRADLRPARRHDRPQIHLPDHHEPDGHRHVLHRRAARLCDLGHPRPDRAGRFAAGARTCARRRIRRRGDLRRRTRAGQQARLLHVVDSNHRDPRPVHGAPADPRHPHLYGRSGIRRLGLAHSVPAVGDPARGLDLDPAQAQ